jgi:hypothetical protein
MNLSLVGEQMVVDDETIGFARWIPVTGWNIDVTR